ncbi:hypothetical protein BZA05DRAFT_407921 [Tricharina praecox]|uniref:uncharacterized protein n=1 Tax=Tricharina praecox TaxID=43433 RepID=UPI00221E86B1|nr:uncharacterized protein BZA05DRAFT_407921 [Tricharina praecox]KAI5845514.1 hypothetical protein BZA05DRAFT_407921 [Tricharina praecox]
MNPCRNQRIKQTNRYHYQTTEAKHPIPKTEKEPVPPPKPKEIATPPTKFCLSPAPSTKTTRYQPPLSGALPLLSSDRGPFRPRCAHQLQRQTAEQRLRATIGACGFATRILRGLWRTPRPSPPARREVRHAAVQPAVDQQPRPRPLVSRQLGASLHDVRGDNRSQPLVGRIRSGDGDAHALLHFPQHLYLDLRLDLHVLEDLLRLPLPPRLLVRPPLGRHRRLHP